MKTEVNSLWARTSGLARGLLLCLAVGESALVVQAQAPKISLSLATNNAVALQWTALPAAQVYRVESRDAFGRGAWQPCPWPDQWLPGTTNWSTARPSVAAQFYRVTAFQTVRGGIVSSRLLNAYTASQLTALFYANGLPIAAQNAVDAYFVFYDTVAPDGAPTRASGAVMLPKGVGRTLPLLSHQHGTVVLTNDVASQNRGEYLLGLVFAGTGYAASLPDYLGMGAGSSLHPYVHARSEATAALDLLRAARTLAAQKSVALNGQVFLIGYSQGGQATMALHKEIETWHTNEFSITASAPMAGPHDMSGTMASFITSNQPYSSPYYLPYTLFSYNSVYHLYESVSEALVEPYATTLPPLFDGRHSESQINAAMPSVPNQILRPEFLQAFRTDPNHPFRAVLRVNDLYNWTPRAEMHLYHCHGDTTVPYANSEIAYNSFRARGASQVQLLDPYPQGNHSSGASYCFLAAKQWFDSLKR